jgi:hypothetical protein
LLALLGLLGLERSPKVGLLAGTFSWLQLALGAEGDGSLTGVMGVATVVMGVATVVSALCVNGGADDASASLPGSVLSGWLIGVVGADPPAWNLSL